VSVDQQVKSFIKAGMSANLSRTDQQITLTDGQQSVTDLMLYNSPATPVKGFDGSYLSTATIQGVPFGNTQNPVALAMLRNVTAKQTKVFGNIYADVHFLKNFTLRNQLNYDFQSNENIAFQPKILNQLTGQLIIGPNRYRQDNANSFYWGFQTYLSYNNTFAAKHGVNIQVGHEAAASKYSNQYATVINTIQNLQSLNAGTIDPSQTNGGKYDWAQESYFARATYTFDNKYSVTGTVRRDGSASFGPGKRHGTFPAVSAGWTVTNENFAKEWKRVSYLKIRAGYGLVGNSQTSGNNYTTNIRLASSAAGLFGQTNAPGVPANVGNPDLGWESVKTLNGGVDVSLLNGRIDISVDLYKKTTTNMLLSTVLPVFAGLDATPPNNSYQDIEPPVTNAGEMTNKGIDISLSSQNIIKKNFTWKTNIIFSKYTNVLNKLNSEAASIPGYSAEFTPKLITLTVPGQAVGSFYGFVTNGLFRSMDDLNNGGTYPLPVGQTGTWLGDIRYADLNGDKVFDDKDVTFIGNPNPKFTYGITNTFTYTNFDLSIFLTGSQGAKIYNFSRMKTEALFSVYQNQSTAVMDRYSEANPNGQIPRYNQWNTNNLRISDRFVEDGSYLRIQNISVGYRLPIKLSGKVKMTSARIYFSAQNLHTFTKYKGYDPELGSFNGNITRMNIDFGHYPNPRTYTIGANIEF
jgi:TonB-linked SusC/RagA family outer membrane protein